MHGMEGLWPYVPVHGHFIARGEDALLQVPRLGQPCDDCQQNRNGCTGKQYCLEFNLELRPFSPIQSGRCQSTQQASGSRHNKIGKRIAQLVSHYGYLAFHAYQVCQRGHNGHGQSRLARPGYYKEIKYGLKNIHQPCGNHRREMFHPFADLMKDGV